MCVSVTIEKVAIEVFVEKLVEESTATHIFLPPSSYVCITACHFYSEKVLLKLQAHDTCQIC